jgi:hypothetical protein
MAVIPSLPGLSVTVEVEGRAAVEFQHPSPDSDNSTIMEREGFDLPPDHTGPLPHVVQYIEGTPGQELEVVAVKDASFHGRSHHLGYTVYIDDEDTGRDQQFPGDPSGRWQSRFSRFSSGNPMEGYQTHTLKFEELSWSKPLQTPDHVLTY